MVCVILMRLGGVRYECPPLCIMVGTPKACMTLDLRKIIQSKRTRCYHGMLTCLVPGLHLFQSVHELRSYNAPLQPEQYVGKCSRVTLISSCINVQKDDRFPTFVSLCDTTS